MNEGSVGVGEGGEGELRDEEGRFEEKVWTSEEAYLSVSIRV